MSDVKLQEWPDGWGPVEQYVLWGVAVEVIARSYRADDILVLFEGAVAEVHLTWIEKRERDSRWPRTVVFPDIETWRRTVSDD